MNKTKTNVVAKLRKTMKVINNVFETKNYNMFKIMEGNREVGDNKKLRGEIKARGILNPVLINEYYEIIDGQHRVEIAKEIEIPVPFIVLVGARKADVISMNTTTSPWNLTDYIESYANEGIEDYIKLADLIETYDVPAGTMSAFAFNTILRGPQVIKVKNKQLEFVDYDFLVEFLEFYQEVIEVTPLKTNRALVTALYILYRIDKFDPNRFKSKSGLISRNLKGITEHNVALKTILEGYNHRLSQGSPNAIEYFENSVGRVEFFEKVKPRLVGLPGETQGNLYRG